MFRRQLGFGLILLLQLIDLRSVSAQQVAQTFTLKNSIEYALNNSKTYQVAFDDVEIAAEKVKEARAALLPHLTLSGGYTFNGDLQTIVLSEELFAGVIEALPEAENLVGNEPIEIELGAEHNFQGQAQINAPLFMWGKLRNTYRQAMLGKKAAEQKREAVRLDLELNVRSAFYGVLLAKAFVDVTQQSLAQVEKRYRVAQDRKEAGTITRLEVIRANVQVVNTRSQLIAAQNQLKLALENLKLTLGLPLDQEIAAEGTLEYQPKQVETDEAIATSIERRPEIKQAEFQEQASEKQVNIAKAGNKPSLSAFGNYIYNDTERQEFDTSWSVGVRVDFPIFDGFATRARINQAKLSLDQIQVNKAQLIDGITLEVKSALFDLEAAQKLIEAQEGIVEEAAEGLRIANVQHEAGLITGVELTDVELSHFQAQVNRLQAVHDYIIAVARLERALGVQL